MSMPKKPLTDDERAGLEAHGLPIGKPSQLSDCFRSGIAWANERIAQLEADCAAHKAAEETQIALRQKADEREAALAAHVERISACRLESGRIGIWSLNNALKETPATSLAKRDLIKQAEALEDISVSPYISDASEIMERATELRQQAEQC